MVSCMDPKEVRSNWIPRGMLTDQPASSRGDGTDSSTYKKVNPGGSSSCFLSTRANSCEWAAPLGSKVGSLSWVGMLSGASFLVSGEEVFSAGSGVMGSFLAMSNIWALTDYPSQVEGMRHLWSSCTALHSTGGGFPDWMTHLWRAKASTTISSHSHSYGGR